MNNLQEKQVATNDVFSINKEFLKSKGIVLVDTGLMFCPYEFDNDDYKMNLGEHGVLSIRNKKTGRSHSVNLVMNLLTESDL